MVREDILAGLKNAISRGESLRQAMMSFYKAGYKKEEIEDAARFIQNEKIQEKTTTDYPVQENKSIQNTPQIKIQNTPQYNSPSNEEIMQSLQQINPKSQISNYSYEQKKSWFGWIILVSGTLIILIAAILAIIFKNQITEFFSNLIG